MKYRPYKACCIYLARGHHSLSKSNAHAAGQWGVGTMYGTAKSGIFNFVKGLAIAEGPHNAYALYMYQLYVPPKERR